MEFAAADNRGANNNDAGNINWLRERGVQIDIPSSRKQPSQPVDPNLDRPITIVKIPADNKKPYEEVTISINDGIAGDQLINLLKPCFLGTGSETISNAALEKASEHLLQSTSQDTPSSSDDSSILDKSPEVQKSTLLNMFENQGHVEAFSLTRPAASNQWKSVALYLDEGGQLKGLPSNSRASSIAAACGYEGVALAGDVYVARRFQEGAIRHVSLSLTEVDSSAGWMQAAHRDNYAHGAAHGQVSMDQSGGVDKGLHTSSDPMKNYEWSQDEDTVDVCFSLPEVHRAVSKKSLRVDISSQTLRVAVVTVAVSPDGVPGEDVLLELNLFAAVKVGDSTWSRSGDCVEFALEKGSEAEWAQLEANA